MDLADWKLPSFCDGSPVAFIPQGLPSPENSIPELKTLGRMIMQLLNDASGQK